MSHLSPIIAAPEEPTPEQARYMLELLLESCALVHPQTAALLDAAAAYAPAELRADIRAHASKLRWAGREHRHTLDKIKGRLSQRVVTTDGEVGG